MSGVQRGMLARCRPQRQVGRVDQAAGAEEVSLHRHHQLSLLALHCHRLPAGDGSRLGVLHPRPGVGVWPHPPACRITPREIPGWVGSHLTRRPAEKSEDQAAFGSHPSFFQQSPAQRAGAALPAFISPSGAGAVRPWAPVWGPMAPKGQPSWVRGGGARPSHFQSARTPHSWAAQGERKHPRQPLWGSCL